jgi:hypothetical protein
MGDIDEVRNKRAVVARLCRHRDFNPIAPSVSWVSSIVDRDRHQLWKTRGRTERQAQIRQNCRERNRNGCGNLMPTRLCGGRERWTVDAVILALGVCLRRRGGVALTDIDRVAARGLLDGAMQTGSGIYHQTRV